MRASIFTKLGRSVGKGNDHLQLIKFWPSCARRKGVCGGAKIFGSTLLQPARSVCVSLSAFLILISDRQLSKWVINDKNVSKRPYLTLLKSSSTRLFWALAVPINVGLYWHRQQVRPAVLPGVTNDL